MAARERIFGAVPGVPEGATFGSRSQVAEAGVHRPRMHGISGSASEGADSIVVSGGYEDDEDYGDELVYTGHGGRDTATGAQIADQTLTNQNLALAVSADRGLPVRVVRGANGDPRFSPSAGFRYDGLFYVESYGREEGRSGFDIWRFRLVREPTENPVTNPSPGPAPGAGGRERSFATVQRLVRNTAVTQWVKELYDYTCQVCGMRLETPAGPYAEGAHIRPVGRPHDGPDAVENVVCLCPNHHVELDRGAIAFDDQFNVLNAREEGVIDSLTVRDEHHLAVEHARFHRAMHGIDQP